MENENDSRMGGKFICREIRTAKNLTQSSARYFSTQSRIPQGERWRRRETERRTVKDDGNFQNVQLIESGLKIRAKLGYHECRACV